MTTLERLNENLVVHKRKVKRKLVVHDNILERLNENT